MTTKLKNSIQNAALNGFVEQDDNRPSSEEFMPQLLHNGDGDPLLFHIQQELEHCSSFTFAVAFVADNILAPIKVLLKDLESQGIRGRILTSNYLNFNQPKAFRELLKLPNVDVRIAPNSGFHAKGYIFDHNGTYQSVVVGSSNLTRSAMMQNYEWNIRFTSYQNGDITKQLIDEVSTEWNLSTELTPEWIDRYEIEYDRAHQEDVHQSKTAVVTDPGSLYGTIKPNQMQQEALKSLADLRASGATRGLVISATGTGKTYLSALDVRQANPKRFLYIVHREQILDKSIASFRAVLGGSADDYGKLSGSHSDLNAKYLFATIQTLAKDQWLQNFAKQHFDYILIDEAHKAGAASYQKVIAYFQPDFLLGMTATPERMDNFNLYELFDYNIAYEIRLQQALDEKMLCPFHYVGVTDYTVDGQTTDETSDLQFLISEERVDYVLQQTEYYGHSGAHLHGLIFCSRKQEANELAKQLTERHHPSIALTGDVNSEKREAAVQALEKGQVEYLITVDIFNEGIDIPCVNQIVMLRNTQSSIIFIQQLGRGLRKFAGKDYVTIIDFIGNYKNNYLIPIALTGDKSRSKDMARDDLNTKQISGISTINFSKIAKETIYQSITNTSLSQLKVLRDDYADLKQRIGRIPLLLDFQKHGTVDASVFAEKYKNYYQFLVKMKEDVHLSIQEEQRLNLVTMELMNGKRQQELILLDSLLHSDSGHIGKNEFVERLKQQHVYHDQAVLDSMQRILSLEFFIKRDQQAYGNEALVTFDGIIYSFDNSLSDLLHGNSWFEKLFKDAVATGFELAKKYDASQPFKLYEKYTRKDVCRLFNWQLDTSSTLYGYRIREHICPIFVTYSKSEDIDESVNYGDEFLNSQTFRWYTRHNVKLNSKEVNEIVDGNKIGETSVHLFVKKSDDEGRDFYYLGEVMVNQKSVIQKEQTTSDGKVEPIVRMDLDLKVPVKYDRYLNITEAN